mgnify:CR=1 FL=1
MPFFRLQFRQGGADGFQPFIADADRRKIRIREITVIFRILFRTHRIGVFLIVIPASRLLDDLPALFQQLNLAGALASIARAIALKEFRFFISVLVPNVSLPTSRTDKLTSARIDLPVTYNRMRQILYQQAQAFKVGNNLISTPHIRLRNDLDQRHTASVVINQRAVFPLVVDQLSGIFLHMNFMNTNFLFTGMRVDRDIAVVADREIQLGNLVVLRVVRVKIVFPVKIYRTG